MLCKMLLQKTLSMLKPVYCRNNYLPYTKTVRNLTATDFKVFHLQRLSGEHEGIITLGLKRPEAKNAIGTQTVASLLDVFNRIKNDKDARVLIIHSLVKGVFCAGADLKEREAMPEAEVAPFVAKLRKSISNLRHVPIPTIAALDGYALGGGLEMALACDIRVAASTAKMGLVETKLAIIPGGGGTQLLPRIVGPAIAKELIFTGRIIDGNQAFKIGLANHVVEQNSDGDSAFKKSLELAEEIKTQGPIAVQLAKMAIDRGLDVDLKSGLSFEQAYYSQTIGTKDRVEGLKAFKEKRPPKYTNE